MALLQAHTHTYTHITTHKRTHTHPHMHNMHTHTHTHTHTHPPIHPHTNTPTHTRTHTHTLHTPTDVRLDTDYTEQLSSTPFYAAGELWSVRLSRRVKAGGSAKIGVVLMRSRLYPGDAHSDVLTGKKFASSIVVLPGCVERERECVYVCVCVCVCVRVGGCARARACVSVSVCMWVGGWLSK